MDMDHTWTRSIFQNLQLQQKSFNMTSEAGWAQMLFFLQLATVASVFAATYLVFQSVGLRRDELFYSKEEKKSFDELISGLFGSYATVANIVGTLTSLATVYVFFIGTSKVFGWYVFVCALSIGLSWRVTNPATKTILLNRPRVSRLYESSDQISSVISTLIWSESDDGRTSSQIVKYISLASICAIIWLEFAIFADVSALILGLDNLFLRAVICSISSFALFYFTFRFGLRGFVFADVFQAPLIIFGSSILLLGVALAFFDSGIEISTVSLQNYLAPKISVGQGLLFVAHVMVLNSFLILVSEGHWLRAWIFSGREYSMQPAGARWTGMTWFLLIIIGLLASGLTDKAGDEGVSALLGKIFLVTENPLFLCGFWIAATSALFSTADAQIYSFLIVRNFDATNGTLSKSSERPGHGVVLSLGLSLCLAIAYLFVRYIGIPFEKLMFLVIPLTLNILPAFAAIAVKYDPPPRALWTSLLFYGLCGVLGLLQADNNFLWTLAGALVPALISLPMLWSRTRKSTMKLFGATEILESN
jgi:hypothetical protein